MASDITERYDRIASAFTDRVRGVDPSRWDDPAPCEGWVARDVVRHLVEWLPGFFAAWELSVAPSPSVDDDPAAAWAAIDAALRAGLADAVMSAREEATFPGTYRFDAAVDMFCTGDLLVHTWDLARATGQDGTLDADEVHRMYEAMGPMDDVLRQSGQFGPKVDVPDDADEQTKLIAFTGRDPNWTA